MQLSQDRILSRKDTVELLAYCGENSGFHIHSVNLRSSSDQT